jgi:transcription elongation factor Elf1
MDVSIFQCKFCQKQLSIFAEYSDDDDAEYKCNDCNAYFIFNNGSIIEYYFYYDSYFANFDEDNSFELIHVNDEYREEILISLNFWPNITPANFPCKIKIYLPFLSITPS